MAFDLGPEPPLLRCAGVFASPQVDVLHRRFSLFSSFPPAGGCRGSENETAAARCGVGKGRIPGYFSLI